MKLDCMPVAGTTMCMFSTWKTGSWFQHLKGIMIIYIQLVASEYDITGLLIILQAYPEPWCVVLNVCCFSLHYLDLEIFIVFLHFPLPDHSPETSSFSGISQIINYNMYVNFIGYSLTWITVGPAKKITFFLIILILYRPINIFIKLSYFYQLPILDLKLFPNAKWNL